MLSSVSGFIAFSDLPGYLKLDPETADALREGEG
jgi:hypothetical protein